MPKIRYAKNQRIKTVSAINIRIIQILERVRDNLRHGYTRGAELFHPFTDVWGLQ